MSEVILSSSNLYCKVIYSVTQDIANNTSTISVALKDLQFKGGGMVNAGTAWVHPNGKIKINDTTLCTSIDDSTRGISIANFGNAEYRSVGIVGAGEWSEDKTITITHDATGDATVTFAVSFTIGGRQGTGLSSWCSVSDSVTVAMPTIGRASNIASAGAAILGDACSVTWTPLSTSFRYKIRFAMGSWSATTGVIHPNKITSYTYNLYTIPLEAARQIPNTTTGTMTATLITYSDASCTTQVGSDSSAVNFKVTVPTTVIPTITGVSATIVNNNSVVNSWGVALAGMTKVKLNGTAAGSYGSTIVNYTITGGYSTTTASWPYIGGAVNKSGNVTFAVQVTDSRGRKSAAATTPAIAFIAYASPSISSFTVARDPASATIANASALFSYSSVKVNNVEKNSVTATLYYKKSSDTSWSSTSLSNNTVKAISVSDTSSYDFKLTVKDALNNSTTLEKYISTMAAVMSFGADGHGLGIGKVAESSNLEIGFKTIFFDDVYIRVGSSNIPIKDYIKGIMNGTYT